jgi:hypothetical protein
VTPSLFTTKKKLYDSVAVTCVKAKLRFIGIPILQIILISFGDSVEKDGINKDGNIIVGDASVAPEVTPPYIC